MCWALIEGLTKLPNETTRNQPCNSTQRPFQRKLLLPSSLDDTHSLALDPSCHQSPTHNNLETSANVECLAFKARQVKKLGRAGEDGNVICTSDFPPCLLDSGWHGANPRTSRRNNLTRPKWTDLTGARPDRISFARKKSTAQFFHQFIKSHTLIILILICFPNHTQANKVHLHFNHNYHNLPHKIQYWTDKEASSHREKWAEVHNHEATPFHIDSDTRTLNIFGYDETTVFYHRIKLNIQDNDDEHHAHIYPNDKISRLEISDHRFLSDGSELKLNLGVLPPKEAYFKFHHNQEGSIKIDAPGGILVFCQRHSSSFHDITPFHKSINHQEGIDLEVKKHDSSNAFGAMISYKVSDQHDHNFESCDPRGRANINKKTISEATAFLPHQSTCGGHHYDVEAKNVYGLSSIKDVKGDSKMELPRIDRIHYELDLHGTYPNEVKLAADLGTGNHAINLEDSIQGDQVRFYVKVGAQKAHLHLVELYNSEITLTPLNPCLMVDSHTLDHSSNRMTVKQSIYDHTVMVVVKAVDIDYQKCGNVTLEYIFAETGFGMNSIETNEDSEIVFRVPKGHLVTFIAHSRYKLMDDNPSAFIARDKLEVYLVFDKREHHKIVASLRADDFHVPSDTLVRYNVYDHHGEHLSKGDLFTNHDGNVEFKTTRDADYIAFDVEGSDGFDPVYYQPFIYNYNMSRHHQMPSRIIIPVKTKKNLIVAVRDCHSGEALDKFPLVRLPDDSAVQHSPIDTSVMLDRHLSFTDKQGLAFFNLKQDRQVYLKVSASGYHDYETHVNIKGRTTYLVNAELCKKSTHR